MTPIKKMVTPPVKKSPAVIDAQPGGVSPLVAQLMTAKPAYTRESTLNPTPTCIARRSGIVE